MSGSSPREPEQPIRGNAHGENRRLRVLGERQRVGGAVEDQIAQRLAERGVGFVEHLAALRELLGERLAHADGLRALSGKKKCNHSLRVTSRATRISCSTRSEHVAARRTATPSRPHCGSALADERPWPTMHSPATPISGAPPYSE